MTKSDKGIVDKDTYFTLGLIQVFKDADVIKRLQIANHPLVSPMAESIKQVMQANTRLQEQLVERDLTIDKLTQEIKDLKMRADDQEQQGRKVSIRVFGIPDETAGSVDDKIHMSGVNMSHIFELFCHSTEKGCQNYCWYQA